MNKYRIARDVGAQYYTVNPAGALHRAISNLTLTAFRRKRAENAMAHVEVDRCTGAVTGEVGHNPCALVWCVASGVARAASILEKTDFRIDNVFGSNLAHRLTPERAAWETEGKVAKLGEYPMHGLTLLGGKLGVLCADVFQCGPRDAMGAKGACMGAIVGGAIAFGWSQSCALVGFALKVLLRVPVMGYTLVAQSYKPTAIQLARDAGYAADFSPFSPASLFF